MLSARTDYGVWYGETEEVALNVVIVKAKNMDSDSGVAQALGYMGKWSTISIIVNHLSRDAN